MEEVRLRNYSRIAQRNFEVYLRRCSAKHSVVHKEVKWKKKPDSKCLIFWVLCPNCRCGVSPVWQKQNWGACPWLNFGAAVSVSPDTYFMEVGAATNEGWIMGFKNIIYKIRLFVEKNGLDYKWQKGRGGAKERANSYRRNTLVLCSYWNS